jgi:hypothetical protein
VIAAQSPGVAPSHASHWPVQRALQHTPSTHICERQTASPVHAEPFAARHVPFNVAPAEVGAHWLPAPQDATVQQTPSVQKPVLGQSLPVVHGSPTPGGATHAPPVHAKPRAQSAADAHVVAHVAPVDEQAYAPHFFGAFAQFPAPSQVPTWTSVPPEQALEPQVVVPVG